MSRKSRRELERRLDDLGDAGTDADVPDEYVINYQVVGSDGAIVDTFERVFSVDR